MKYLATPPSHALPRVARSRPTASSHIKFSLGDVVREKDGRHHARVDRVRSSIFADLTWNDSGWKSLGVDTGDLELVPAEER